MSGDLHWLPPPTELARQLARVLDSSLPRAERMQELRRAVATRLDFIQTTAVDRALRALLIDRGADDYGLPGVRLAIVASSTVEHLVPAVRVGALRHGLLADCWTAPYGQVRQTVMDPASPMSEFAPHIVLFGPDYRTTIPRLPLNAEGDHVDRVVRRAVDDLVGLWRVTRTRTSAAVVQQTIIDGSLPLFGGIDRQVPASPLRLTALFNDVLARAAASEGVLLVDLAWWAGQIGVRTLSDPMLWHHAKQELSPAAAPLYGDLVGRTLAAIRGRSRKCLVLDLDNTLWGGTIGDDGLAGIVLGPGSAVGEAYLDFQQHLKQLTARGVVLAISSKNDEAVVLDALDRHPEMALRRDDFVAMVVNWHDKPTAVQQIAAQLSLTTDAMVFFDDNPAERELMRRTLPEVAVPEVPEAVEQYARCLADAGYFEAASFTSEDAQRTRQYAANIERRQLAVRCTDVDAFLAELGMEIVFAPFDDLNRTRIVQLINKTNQFNLTGRPYTDVDVQQLMSHAGVLTLQMRVKDRFGDNGIVAVVIGRSTSWQNRPAVEIDTWLMSCRVLGRRLERATLQELCRVAAADGAEMLVGRYVPTGRNTLVHDHYLKLGFTEDPANAGLWLLPTGSALGPGDRP